MKELTEKQRAFVREYVLDKNGTQAAIRAGYSAATASEQAYDLLRKPQIQAGVTEAIEAAAARNETTFDRWIRRMWEEADDFSEMASHSARISALKEIGKAFGYYEMHNKQQEQQITEIRLVPLLSELFAAAGKSIVRPNPNANVYRPDDEMDDEDD